jgi:hypothetical protein
MLEKMAADNHFAVEITDDAAVINDDRMAKGEPPVENEKCRLKVLDNLDSLVAIKP